MGVTLLLPEAYLWTQELRQPGAGGGVRGWVTSGWQGTASSHVVLECTPQHADLQAQIFLSHPNRAWESSCSKHVWLETLQALHPHGHKIVFDIGCNVGDTSAEFFDVFAPELGVNKHTVWAAQPEPRKCTVCDPRPQDCQEVRHSLTLQPGRSRTLDVLCFEPSDLHYARLMTTRASLFTEAPAESAQVLGLAGNASMERRVGASTGRWHIHLAAVSDFLGSAPFSSACEHERCSLSDSNSTYVVPVVTVDQVIRDSGWSHVFILKIDTEGYDPSVLRGAENALRRKAITIIQFEYHGVGLWANETLRDMTSWLYGLGYSCYFEGKPLLYKLSRGCWDDAYDIHNWSNVVCGLADSYVEELLDSFSQLRFIQASHIMSYDTENRQPHGMADGTHAG